MSRAGPKTSRWNLRWYLTPATPTAKPRLAIISENLWSCCDEAGTFSYTAVAEGMNDEIHSQANLWLLRRITIVCNLVIKTRSNEHFLDSVETQNKSVVQRASLRHPHPPCLANAWGFFLLINHTHGQGPHLSICVLPCFPIGRTSIDDGIFKLFPSKCTHFWYFHKSSGSTRREKCYKKKSPDQPKSAQSVFQDSPELLGELSLKNWRGSSCIKRRSRLPNSWIPPQHSDPYVAVGEGYIPVLNANNKPSYVPCLRENGGMRDTTYFPVGLTFMIPLPASVFAAVTPPVTVTSNMMRTSCIGSLEHKRMSGHLGHRQKVKKVQWPARSGFTFPKSTNVRPNSGLIHVPSLSFPVSLEVPTVQLILYVIFLMRTLARRLHSNACRGEFPPRSGGYDILRLKASFDPACYGLYCIFQLRLYHIKYFIRLDI